MLSSLIVTTFSKLKFEASNSVFKWQRSLIFTHLIIESDFKVVVDLINCPITSSHHPYFTLISNCRLLMDSLEDCQLEHIYREANQPADRLVHHKRKLNSSSIIFTCIPSFLLMSFYFDFYDCYDIRLSNTKFLN